MSPNKSWIYESTKEQLITIAGSYGIDTSGKLDEIRARMSRYVEAHPEKFATPPIPTMTSQPRTPMSGVNVLPTLAIPPATSPCLPAPPTPLLMTEEPRDNHAKILNQIRKWGCPFDGRDPVAFLERVEELREGYRYSGEQLLSGLPELLRSDVLLWQITARTGTRGKTLFEIFAYNIFPRNISND